MNLSLIALAFLGPVLRGQAADDPECLARRLVDESAPTLQGYIDSRRQVGMVLGVLDGEHRFSRGFGHLSLEPGSPVPDQHTLFEVGSISKAFTGVLLADQVALGNMSLDDSITEFLPPDVADGIGPARVATLRHLATHSAGLPREILLFADNQTYTYDETTRSATAEQYYEFLANFDPGDGLGQWGYSNGSFELLQERLCTRLGLKDTRVYMPSGPDRERAAAPHRLSSKWGRLAVEKAFGYYENYFPASGCVTSSVADMLTFLHAHLHPDGYDKSGKLQETIDLALAAHWRSDQATFGPGWGRELEGDVMVHMKNGMTMGHYAFVVFCPETDRAAVLLSNTACSSTLFQRFERMVVDLVLPGVDELKSRPTQQR